MNLSQAIQAANDGHKVRRASWPAGKTITGKDGVVSAGKEPFQAEEDDNRANDWQLDTETTKLTAKEQKEQERALEETPEEELTVDQKIALEQKQSIAANDEANELAKLNQSDEGKEKSKTSTPKKSAAKKSAPAKRGR